MMSANDPKRTLAKTNLMKKRNTIVRPGLLITLTIAALSLQPVFAGSESGIHFSHKDWEVACDNTLTCRAAGYQDDDDEFAVSVLLTRTAGPRKPVKGRLRIGNHGTDDFIEKLPITFTLKMEINGKSYGNVTIDKDSLKGELSENQVSGLVSSLKHKSNIKWILGKYVWRLSDKGAAAVLIKMDEYQGRLGTIGALIKTGKLGENSVLLAKPMPLVNAAKVANHHFNDKLLSNKEKSDLKNKLRRTIKKDDYCPILLEADSVESRLTIDRLNDKKRLASVLCWTAAYNAGIGYWVIDDKEAVKPVLVTTSATGYSDGEISSVQKGRGIGDCLSEDVWTWNGERFVHSKSSTTGMCKLLAPGGTWVLPTLVSEIRKH